MYTRFSCERKKRERVYLQWVQSMEKRKVKKKGRIKKKGLVKDPFSLKRTQSLRTRGR